MTNFLKLDIPTFTDSRGSLSVIEDFLPFHVVRTYWIYGADGQTRGGHRHVHTRQALVAISGRITVYLNNGIREETVELSHPSKCLLVEPKDWHTMKFENSAVLLVMSSHAYDRSEYIEAPYE